MKETIKQGTVFEKKVTELFINGEDTVTVLHIYQFERHRGSTLYGIFITTGRAETAMATERNKL